MPNERPNPDELLRRLADEEKRRKRGKLTIFFGAAPGVGKTYAMLEVARAVQAEEQRDVAVGVVETHGRLETAGLMDELAHTNAEGSRHPKRWQDVEELLDAGIDVFATMNVQHVESLNDVVAQITGVRVRETVPDS